MRAQGPNSQCMPTQSQSQSQSQSHGPYTANWNQSIIQIKQSKTTWKWVHSQCLCSIHGYLLPHVEADNMAST